MGISRYDADREYMRQALTLAGDAFALSEVPVGAIIVCDNKVVGRGFNRPVSEHDPSAHAEIVAIRDAAKNLGNYRLVDATLYVTLEPCIMCAGAILQGRIRRLVFGAWDERFGAAGSRLNLVESDFLNHRAVVTAGVLVQESKQLLENFFSQRR